MSDLKTREKYFCGDLAGDEIERLKKDNLMHKNNGDLARRGNQLLSDEIERLEADLRLRVKWQTEVAAELKLANAVVEAGVVWMASEDAGHSSACSEEGFCEVSYAYCEACKLRDAIKATLKGADDG